MLFWFDYLTADVLGVSMCIDRVQNKPTTLSQILLTLFKLWMKISWSLKVFFISVQALYSYPNQTLEDLLSLSLFFFVFFAVSNQTFTRLSKDTKNMSSQIDSTVRKLPEATDPPCMCFSEQVYGQSCCDRWTRGRHLISWQACR